MTAQAVRSGLKHVVVAALIATGLGASLSACGNSGTDLAKQACTHINRSIRLLEQSQHQSDHARAAQLAEQAYDQLRAALPIAAQAAFHDGQWQALMTTISESNRVPESTLVDALTAQCGEADSTIFGQTPPPSSIPPPAPAQS
ncbi:MAG: hypothetical protein ABSF33_11485 [Acidimicrobiales bacterium]